MAKLIQDVKPPYRPKPLPPETLRTINRTTDANYIEHTDTDILITELHDRGVSIQDVFAQYYAMEAAEDAHSDELFGNDEQGQHGKPLTVGDAELAGLTPQLPNQPLETQPF